MLAAILPCNRIDIQLTCSYWYEDKVFIIWLYTWIMVPYSFDYAPIPIIRLHRWNKVGISAYLIIEPILSFWFHLYMKDIKTAM